MQKRVEGLDYSMFEHIVDYSVRYWELKEPMQSQVKEKVYDIITSKSREEILEKFDITPTIYTHYMNKNFTLTDTFCELICQQFDLSFKELFENNTLDAHQVVSDVSEVVSDVSEVVSEVVSVGSKVVSDVSDVSLKDGSDVSDVSQYVPYVPQDVSPDVSLDVSLNVSEVVSDVSDVVFKSTDKPKNNEDYAIEFSEKTVIEMFNDLFKNNYGSKQKFIKEFNYPRKTFYRYLNFETRPTLEFLEDLQKFFNIKI